MMGIISKVKRKLNIRNRVKRLTNKIKNRVGLADQFYCPCCESYFDNWLPFTRNIGNGKTRVEPGGRRCPVCKSMERTRHFRLYLEKFKVLESKPRFLHFAPEWPLRNWLRKNLGSKYVTCDLMMKDVDRKEDITALTFANASFDFIYCSNVLEHVPDDAAAMKELYRVLTPDGTAIIHIPNKGEVTVEDFSVTDEEERFKLFGQSDHVRYYGRDVRDRLANAGFKVEEIIMKEVLGLSPKELHKMNLDKWERVHRCTKK